MRTRTLGIPFTLALLLAIGCGGNDSTGPGGSVLTDEGAAALADLVMGSTVGALESPGGSPSLAVPVAINAQFSRTQACPTGGQIGVSGNLTGAFDSDTGSGSAWLQVMGTYTDCGLEANGVGYVVNGNPYLTITGSFTWLGGAPATQQTVRIGGALDINGRFCAINLTILYAMGGQSTTSVSGTVCGVSVNRNL